MTEKAFAGKGLLFVKKSGAFKPVVDNHMLHDAIDAQFKSATSLGEYDEFHKHYKINHFLESQNAK